MADIPFSKKPAIFVKNQPKTEDLLATAVIYLALRNQQKEPTVIFSKNEQVANTLKSLVSGINIKHELPTKKFVISFKKDNANVETIQWQQDPDAIKIFVTLNQGKLNPADLKLDVAGSDYDLAILPNVSELAQLGDISSKNAEFFKDAKLFSIGTDLNLGDQYQISSSNKPNQTTLSEQVFYCLSEGNIKADQAQLLLAGIMHETKNLKADIKNPDLFVVMKKLVEKGASTAKVEETLSKARIQAAGGQNSGQTSTPGNGGNAGSTAGGNNAGGNFAGGSSTGGSTAGGTTSGNSANGGNSQTAKPAGQAQTAPRSYNY